MGRGPGFGKPVPITWTAKGRKYALRLRRLRRVLRVGSSTTDVEPLRALLRADGTVESVAPIPMLEHPRSANGVDLRFWAGGKNWFLMQLNISTISASTDFNEVFE